MAEEYMTHWKTVLKVSNTFLKLVVESPGLGELQGCRAGGGHWQGSQEPGTDKEQPATGHNGYSSFKCFSLYTLI